MDFGTVMYGQYIVPCAHKLIAYFRKMLKKPENRDKSDAYIPNGDFISMFNFTFTNNDCNSIQLYWNPKIQWT